MARNLHELDKPELLRIIERLATERDQLHEALLAMDSYQNSWEYGRAKKLCDAALHLCEEKYLEAAGLVSPKAGEG